MPRPIIIDTDPGTDDAVAILLALAAPELEVLGLVAVAGNLPLATTERNARAILELAGRPEIPVYAGCPRPISPGVVTAEHAHGESGLGGLVLPVPALMPRPEHGVDVLVEMLRRAAPRGVTVRALGNTTPAAEFNIHADPLAAALVFDSAVPITMIPLDLTHQVPATPERIERIRALGNRCGLAAAELMGPPRRLRRGRGVAPA